MNTRSLFVENLSPRQLMAIDVVELEPNNTESQATQFQFSGAETVTLHGNSTSQDDKDYFVFTANASGSVNVAVSSAAGAKLEVTTRQGAELFETEPKDGLTSGSFQSVAGTTYLLRLRAPDKSPAPYAVTLDSTDASGNTGGATGGSTSGDNSGPTVSELEPNDDANHAVQATLNANEPRTLTGSASKKDRDYFAITSATAGTFNVDVGNAEVKVSVETSSGKKLFESEPNDGVTKGAFSVVEGQAVVLRVRGLSSSATNYSVAVSIDATPVTNTSTTATQGARAVPIQWLDASNDGSVSPLDALLVINQLSRGHQSAHDAVMLEFDMNDDNLVSPIDALLVINHLTRHNRGADDLHAEGESVQVSLRTVGSDDVSETEIHRNRRRGR